MAMHRILKIINTHMINILIGMSYEHRIKRHQHLMTNFPALPSLTFSPMTTISHGLTAEILCLLMATTSLQPRFVVLRIWDRLLCSESLLVIDNCPQDGLAVENGISMTSRRPGRLVGPVSMARGTFVVTLERILVTEQLFEVS